MKAKHKKPTLDSIAKRLRKELQRARKLHRQVVEDERREREELRKLGLPSS